MPILGNVSKYRFCFLVGIVLVMRTISCVIPENEGGIKKKEEGK